MTMSPEMARRIAREKEQTSARLQFLEHHQQGLGREAALLKRRLVMLEAITAAGKVTR